VCCALEGREEAPLLFAEVGTNVALDFCVVESLVFPGGA
jgi:hypothetical protein